LTHDIRASGALEITVEGSAVSGVSVDSWVTVSVVVDSGESVSVGVVVVSGISLGISLTLGNLVDDTGGRAGVVAGDSLVCNGGNNGGGVSNSLGDGVDGWDNVLGLSWNWSWVSDSNGGLLSGLLLSGLLLSGDLISLGNGGSVDNWVVLVVHGGVAVVHGSGVVVHGGVVVVSSGDNVLIGYNWGGVCLVDVLAIGVVVEGIGFRLSKGHGGESENYELEKEIGNIYFNFQFFQFSFKALF
jgi:hypothetical protein